jgi:hypothetical protein
MTDVGTGTPQPSAQEQPIRQSAGQPSLYPDVRRKLVVGTEVLRTGGGASLTAAECGAVLDRLADLERVAEAVRDYVAEPNRDNEDRLAQVNLEAHRG